jgi:hypothetical protein
MNRRSKGNRKELSFKFSSGIPTAAWDKKKKGSGESATPRQFLSIGGHPGGWTKQAPHGVKDP